NRQALFGPDHPETLEAMGGLAGAHAGARQRDKSARLLEQLLEKQRAIYGPTHGSTLGTMHSLAVNYEDLDRRDESLALVEKVQEARKSASSVFFKLCFAYACQRAGKLDQAEHLLREALEQCRKQHDSPSQREQTANTLGWLARTLLLKRQYDEA